MSGIEPETFLQAGCSIQLSYKTSIRSQNKDWCPPRESNSHTLQYSHLKAARLPFRQVGIITSKSRKFQTNPLRLTSDGKQLHE